MKITRSQSVPEVETVYSSTVTHSKPSMNPRTYTSTVHSTQFGTSSMFRMSRDALENSNSAFRLARRSSQSIQYNEQN
jgi:hypothetical protein